MKKPISSLSNGAICISLLIVSVMLACSNPSQKVVELKRFPIDSLDGIITKSGAELDKDNSSDGKGSLRVNVKNPATVRLFEVHDIGIEGAVLTYRAKVRAKGLAGRAYLEMRCHFPDREEELLATDAQAALTGTTKWM